MESRKITTQRAALSVDAFDGMSLTDYERAVAKARMAQAETIADGFVSLFRGIAAAAAAVRNAVAGLGRRVRTVFMKPAHH
jgi:hypothetical protein